jgi:hypothetical protein
MSLVPDVYELIRAATLGKRQVLATYKGHRRELCPHVLGTKEGRRQALFFQFGGGSWSALPPGGDWRCIPVDGLEDVVVREGPWHTVLTNSNPRHVWRRSTSRRRATDSRGQKRPESRSSDPLQVSAPLPRSALVLRIHPGWMRRPQRGAQKVGARSPQGARGA